jgi:hypothetical protein
MLLAGRLYVPDLGANLLPARRLCEAGLTGSFITDGYEETAFPGIETDAVTTNVEEHVYPHTTEKLSTFEQEIYMLWHRPFSHPSSKDIRNIHQISTLVDPIKLPVKQEPCKVCALIKNEEQDPKRAGLTQTGKASTDPV